MTMACANDAPAGDDSSDTASTSDSSADTGTPQPDVGTLDSGQGADVLGHPFAALTWLANHLSAGSRGLRTGDIVATGSMIPTRVPLMPEVCSFALEGLGEVSLAIQD